MAGVVCGGESEPVIAKTVCEKNKLSGVSVQDKSKARIEDCRCNENGACGVGCLGESELVIVKTVCEKNKVHGVGVGDKSKARTDECRCNENTECGVVTFHESSAAVTTSTCCMNGHSGLSQEGGRLTHSGCTLSGNKKGDVKNC